MRSLSLARLVFASLFGLAWIGLAGESLAQAPKPKEVTFKTKDYVDLVGTFYPSAKGRDAYCVMLLPNLGGKMQDQGWDTLAQELQKADFAVLAFDFRGHGNSKNISPGEQPSFGNPGKPGFWTFSYNLQAAKRFDPRQPPKTIDFKDFQTAYYSMLINDIAAAKLFLDERNDAGECNSSRMVVIGAQESAVLGLMWMYSECYRYKVLIRPAGAPPTPQFVKLTDTSEAEGLGSAVWLSMSTSLGGHRMSTDKWLNVVGTKYEVPMGFLYGSQDEASKNISQHCVKILQGNKNDKNPLTAERAIKETKLVGAGLLNKDLDTTATIVGYLSKVRDQRKAQAWKKKDVGASGFFWNLPGAFIEAKVEKEDVMNFVPVSQLR